MADPHLVSAYLSNSVTIYNFEDSTCSKTAYFTISNDKIVGMLTVVEYEGEYYSSYALEAPTEIKTAFSTSTPFALGYINDQLAIITQSEITLLSANPDSKTDTFNELNTASVTYTTLIKTDTIIADSPMRATMYMRIHDVRRVPNEGSRCWAAAVASIGNYHRYTNYTTSTLIAECMRYQTQQTGAPKGNATWYTIAYRNIFDMNLNIKGVDGFGIAPLTSNEIYGNLYTYGPFQISVSRIKPDGSSVSHVLVISGIWAENSESYPIQYYIIDPNNPTESAVICNVNYDVMQNVSNFVYVPPYSPDRIDNDWYRTIIVMPLEGFHNALYNLCVDSTCFSVIMFARLCFQLHDIINRAN